MKRALAFLAVTGAAACGSTSSGTAPIHTATSSTTTGTGGATTTTSSGAGGTGGTASAAAPFDVGEGSLPSIGLLPGTSPARFVVSWHSKDGLQARQYEADGAAVPDSDVVVVADTQATWSEMATSPGGHSFVAWQHGAQPADGPGLDYGSFGADGSLGPIEFSLPPPGVGALAANAAQYLLAWTDGAQLYAHLFNQYGSGTATPTRTLGPATGTPAVLPDGDSFVIVWNDASGKVLGSRVNGLGYLLGSVFELGTGTNLRATLGKGSKFFVVSNAGGTFAVRLFGSPGSPSIAQATLAAPDPAAAADIAADPAGDLLVVWANGSGSTCEDFTAQPFAPGLYKLGSVSFGPGEGCGRVRVAVDEAGNAMAVWQKDATVRAVALPRILDY